MGARSGHCVVVVVLGLALGAAGCDPRSRYAAAPPGRFEAARVACGPERDARHFAEQAITGACALEPGAPVRRHDRGRLADPRFDRVTVQEIAGRGAGPTLLVTIDDASDDSVRAEEHRLELEPTPAGWRIAWVGVRWRCWPGRGHEDFGLAPCS